MRPGLADCRGPWTSTAPLAVSLGLPENWATKDCVQSVLAGAGMRAVERARADVLKDQRFEHLDDNATLRAWLRERDQHR